MRKKALILVAAAGMAVGATQLAFAAVESHISIAYNQDTEKFHGKVTSPDPECKAGRTVKLYRKTADGKSLEGKTISKAKGGWRIEVMHPDGHYFAVTPREMIMDVDCGKARSKTIDIM